MEFILSNYSSFLFLIPLSFIFLIPKSDKKIKKEFTQRKISDVIKQAFKDKSYRYLILGFFVCGLHVALISNYLPTFAKLNGLDTTIAATGLTLVGFLT